MDVEQLRRQARVARQAGDWQTLRQIGQNLRIMAPNMKEGFLIEAAALRRLDRMKEAQTLMTHARQQFPDLGKSQKPENEREHAGATANDADHLRRDAGAAQKQRNWGELERLATALRNSAPDDPSGYFYGARAHRHQKRIQAAERMSAAGLARCPTHTPLLSERGAILLRMQKVADAADCFARIRTILPEQPNAWIRHADALMRLGHFQEAAALLDEALAKFPRHTGLLAQAALSAARANRLDVAKGYWEELRRVDPNDARLRNAFGGIDYARSLHDLTDAAFDDDAQETGARTPQSDDASILRRFESLGGNCEFGLIQRAGGAEPLGLLRFSGITGEELVAMLQTRLAGVGQPENTKLSLNINNEYWLEDTRYFRTHTFLTGGVDDEAAAVLERVCKRTRFLKEKLLKDIASGNKIMVFRPADGVLDEPLISRLHQALRELGPARLLYVADSGAESQSPQIARRSDDLFVGVLPGEAGKLSLKTVDKYRYRLWLRLCQAVVAAI